jgi:hypothetical protein
MRSGAASGMGYSPHCAKFAFLLQFTKYATLGNASENKYLQLHHYPLL